MTDFTETEKMRATIDLNYVSTENDDDLYTNSRCCPSFNTYKSIKRAAYGKRYDLYNDLKNSSNNIGNLKSKSTEGNNTLQKMSSSKQRNLKINSDFICEYVYDKIFGFN